MEACYGGTDVMERSCAVARGIDTNTNTGHRKGLPQKPGSRKPATFFLHIPTSCGDRPASLPGFSASHFPRFFFDLEASIYRAPLYISLEFPAVE
jgi:hypothetical protein